MFAEGQDLLENPRMAAIEYLRTLQNIHDIEFTPDAQMLFEDALERLIERCRILSEEKADEVEARLSKELDEIKEDLADEAEEHDKEMRELRASHDEVLKELQKKHAEEFANIKAAHHAEILRLHHEHTSDSEELKSQHKSQLLLAQIQNAPRLVTVEGSVVLVRTRRHKNRSAWDRLKDSDT